MLALMLRDDSLELCDEFGEGHTTPFAHHRYSSLGDHDAGQWRREHLEGGIDLGELSFQPRVLLQQVLEASCSGDLSA